MCWSANSSREFLEVPQECLILTMKANQKYFPLLDAAGKLTNKFLVVSNIRPDDASAVIGGNERVVRPRLADAKFFFDQDRKKTLVDRVRRPGQGGLPQQAGHAGRARASACARSPARSASNSAAPALAAAGRPRRAAGQGRPADRHGGRVPRTAGHDGRLLRAPRWRERGRRGGDRRPLQAAFRRRRTAAQHRRSGRRAGRQAGDAGRPVRHRPDAHRRQGSVCVAPACAGRDRAC